MFKIADPKIGKEQAQRRQRPPAALLLSVHGQEVNLPDDRVRLDGSVTVGRERRCDLTLEDPCMSAAHFRVILGEGDAQIQDIDSTNGTFVNGLRMEGRAPLPSGSLIRAGTCLFVYHEDGEALLESPAYSDLMAGHFHLRAYLEPLRWMARAGRHVLITGPSGVGKALAAKAFARESGRDMLTHNAACFGTASDAATTLYGIVSGVYTDAAPRTGLIERAHGKVLFLDGAHHYPEGIQKSLLRAVEEHRICPVGGNVNREVNLRYVFASSEPGPTFGLIPELVAQLRVVEIPSLSERMADIPAIFLRVTQDILEPLGMDKTLVAGLFSPDHYESLCLDGFSQDNTHGLIRLAEEMAEELIERGELSMQEAVDRVFSRHYGDGPVANRIYQRNFDTRRLTLPPSVLRAFRDEPASSSTPNRDAETTGPSKTTTGK